MPNPRNRIDEKGRYCPIPGTTIVSAIRGSDTEFWRVVYNQLKNSPAICRYYSLLPYESYHMTAIALDTVDDLPENEDWVTFINTKIPFYSKLHNVLSTQQIIPNIKFDVLSERNLIVLYVHLPQKQESAIRELAKQHNCEDGIPMCFHITLAYQYNKNFTEEDYLKIIEELEPLSRTFKEEQSVTLDPLKLCYFKDMTRFTSWNGTTNPFITPPSSSFSLYSFYRTVKETLSSIPCCHAARNDVQPKVR